MKKVLSIIFIFCFIPVCLFGCAINNRADNNNEPYFMKAGWVPTVWGLNFPSVYTKNSETLKQELFSIVSDAKTLGLNTLFFQVRPAADSFYNSQIFPWSRYLTGTQGVAPNNGFDPLSCIINECHKEGIQLHAWVNPFRVTASGTDTLVWYHPAMQHPELTFTAGGKLYFNPGHPDARQLVIDGICEIALNYNIDGIHFDDYFYPENITTEDLDVYNMFKGEFESIEDFRRASINSLIEEAGYALKEIDENIMFGVSPPGIWANSWHNPLGSDTNGFESYYAIYADSRLWAKEGLIDYIAPQLYWKVGQTGSDFLKLIKWWSDVCEGTGTSLIIGLAGYKNFPLEEYEKQIEYSLGYASGFSVYSFLDIKNMKEVILTADIDF